MIWGYEEALEAKHDLVDRLLGIVQTRIKSMQKQKRGLLNLQTPLLFTFCFFYSAMRTLLSLAYLTLLHKTAHLGFYSQSEYF